MGERSCLTLRVSYVLAGRFLSIEWGKPDSDVGASLYEFLKIRIYFCNILRAA